jgi:capsular exopolysaccharide family
MIFKKKGSKVGGDVKSKIKEIDLSSIQNNIINSNSSFYIKEAYKTLRTNITFSLPMQGCKTIAVTSSLASEGKSINCLNLAITFAETGAKVLLIDCDLRRPNVARLLDKSATPGISNVLVNLSDLNTVMQKTDYDNLDVIYSGDIPPNPTELLSSPKMGEVLQILAEQYDYIFLDTPPVNLIADTTILSKYASGIVVIVRQNSSVKDALLDTVNQLKFAEAKILGFVLNGAPVVAGGKYKKYSKYKGYYRYGQEYSSDHERSKIE